MINKHRVLEVLFDAVDSVNELLDEDKQIAKSFDTVLIGDDSQLDSLGLINFILAVEEKVADEFNEIVVLADETLFDLPERPFRSIDALADYITNELRRRV